jgi:hypothetical protein
MASSTFYAGNTSLDWLSTPGDGPSLHLRSLCRRPDAVDWDDREFNNKAEPVKQELWVSLPHTVLFNTSHSLHILEIMYGYIAFVCRISSDARLDTRRESRPSSATMVPSLGRR